MFLVYQPCEPILQLIMACNANAAIGLQQWFPSSPNSTHFCCSPGQTYLIQLQGSGAPINCTVGGTRGPELETTALQYDGISLTEHLQCTPWHCASEAENSLTHTLSTYFSAICSQLKMIPVDNVQYMRLTIILYFVHALCLHEIVLTNPTLVI
jgi:hypothetical protein